MRDAGGHATGQGELIGIAKCLLGAPGCADVASDLRCSDDVSVRIEDGGDSQRDDDIASILVAAEGFVVIGALAAADLRKNVIGVFEAVGRGEDGGWAPD